MSPAVSVCIPVYNGEPHLKGCLESVLAQSESDLEVIVVDNCSEDGSLAVAEAFAEQDRRIAVHRNSRNIGLVANLNRCIDLASSPWIKFVFHDDWLAPTCVERLLTGAPSSLVVCQRTIEFDDVGRDVRRRYLGVRHWDSLDAMFPGRGRIAASDFLDAALRNVGVNFVGEPTATLMSTEAVRRLGGFDPELVQFVDWDLWLRLGGDDGLHYVGEPLATFRVHAAGATAANSRYRAYEARYLDPLRIVRRMGRDAAYAPVRAFATERGVDLDGLAVRFGVRAEVAAGQAADDGRTAWARFLAADPELAALLDARATPAQRLLERYVRQTHVPLGPVRWLGRPVARHVARTGRAVVRRLRQGVGAR
ncbi:MAG TPA: glycosyltransferase [Acidimicrobiales bacterium]|nr:glycosyltransferase [Acidimicrobiales bacterium]